MQNRTNIFPKLAEACKKTIRRLKSLGLVCVLFPVGWVIPTSTVVPAGMFPDLPDCS